MPFQPSTALLDELVETLRQIRCARGLSQLDLDAHIGWADGLTSKYEAGMRRATLGALELWAAGLDARLAIIPALPLATIRPWRGRVFAGGAPGETGRPSQPRCPRGSRGPNRALRDNLTEVRNV